MKQLDTIAKPNASKRQKETQNFIEKILTSENCSSLLDKWNLVIRRKPELISGMKLDAGIHFKHNKYKNKITKYKEISKWEN